jgi:hypothetical protein
VKQAVELGLFENGGLNLADLAKTHGQIEHDVSLTRQDKALGSNWKRDTNLIMGLLAQNPKEKYLTKKDIAHWRNMRYKMSKRSGKDLSWALTDSGKSMIVASLEATLISALFGRKEGNYFSDRRIRKDHLKEFLLYEKLPYALGKMF